MKDITLAQNKVTVLGSLNAIVMDRDPDHDVATSIAEAVEDAFRYDRLVLASITYQGEIFPFMSTFIHTLAEHAYQNRTVALVEAGSWAPAAAKVMTK